LDGKLAHIRACSYSGQHNAEKHGHASIPRAGLEPAIPVFSSNHSTSLGDLWTKMLMNPLQPHSKTDLVFVLQCDWLDAPSVCFSFLSDAKVTPNLRHSRGGKSPPRTLQARMLADTTSGSCWNNWRNDEFSSEQSEIQLEFIFIR